MAATATHEGVVMCLPLFAAKKDADACRACQRQPESEESGW
jgi:hypothetical protein